MALLTPPVDKFSNVDLNALASQYADDFGHDENILVRRITNKLIFDAAPQRFFDLKLMNMKSFEGSNSDEFFFQEAGYGRDPFVAVTGAGAVTHPSTQTFQINNLEAITVDTIVAYPNNEKGVVTSIDTTASTITISPYTNDALPAVIIGDEFGNISPVEADGQQGISQFFRQDVIERFNFIQMLVKATRFGRMEMHKFMNAGATDGYIALNKRRLLDQYRADLSNIVWNGKLGEVPVASGAKAKTTQGIFPAMVASGSPNAVTTVANVDAALEDMVLSSQFQKEGSTRFLFGTPRRIHDVGQKYKLDKTRYAPNETISKLGLDEISLAGERIVFVPLQRWIDSASFPAAFADRLILLDLDTLTLKQTWADEMHESLNRQGGILDNATTFWVEGTIGVQLNNPLASAFIDIIA